MMGEEVDPFVVGWVQTEVMGSKRDEIEQVLKIRRPYIWKCVVISVKIHPYQHYFPSSVYFSEGAVLAW